MNFYSYLWLREDGSPYYVGKGYGKRAFVRGSHHCRPPRCRSRILVFPMLNEAEAFESEIALIELFGRKDNETGCLRNFTNGGDGVSGLRHTTAAKAKMSMAHRGKPGHSLTEEHIAAMAAGRRGKKRKPPTEETRRKISEANQGKQNCLGHQHSEDSKQKMRITALAREARKREIQ